MDVAKKSIGVLIDELITTSRKCWHFQQIVMASDDVDEVAIAAKNAQDTNAIRNALVREIDKRLETIYESPTPKTYAK